MSLWAFLLMKLEEKKNFKKKGEREREAIIWRTKGQREREREVVIWRTKRQRETERGHNLEMN